MKRNLYTALNSLNRDFRLRPVCFVILIVFFCHTAMGQEKTLCEKLVEKMESEAKDSQNRIKELEDQLKSEAKVSQERIKELDEQLKKADQQSQTYSAELQKTRELLKKEQDDPRKEQIKQQKEQIKRLQKDSDAVAKNFRTVVAERDRLKNAETERNRIKASYDSILAELNGIRSQRAKDMAEIARLRNLETEKDNLKTSHDSTVSELEKIRSRWTKDTAETRRANEECRNIQADLNRKLADLDTGKRNTQARLDSLARILNEIKFKIAVKDAGELLNCAYGKADINKSIAELDKIPAFSPSRGEAVRIRSLLQQYNGKWNRFKAMIEDVKRADSNSNPTSMTMKAQHLIDIFSWIKSSRFDAFAEFRDYPFLLKKLQELTVLKIENVSNNIDNILE
jgi:DNA repair exonuclease SbcCD ATPase subunit